MRSRTNDKNFIRFKKGYKKELLNDILKQISHGESFTILGMPGIGKTDLLMTFDKNLRFWKSLFPKNKVDFLIVLLDLAELLDVSPTGFYRLLLTRLHENVLDNVKDIKPQKQIEKIYKDAINSQDLLTVYNAVENIIRILLDDVGLRLCFIIDDFALLNDFDKIFFNSLRAIRNINKWRISLAFSSDIDILSISSHEKLDELYIFLHNRQFWLKPISEKDALLGMEEWERERGIKLSKEAKQKIFEFSCGHPGYMRALSQVYFSSDEDLSIFTKDKMDELATHPAVVARSDKFWAKLLDKYKEFLVAFVQDPTLLPIEDEQKYLENVGIIVNHNGQRSVFCPLLENYITKKIGQDISEEVTVKEGLFIHPKSKTIYVDGKPLKKEPTPSEFKILNLLYENKGELVLRQQLAEILWGKNVIEKYSDWAIDRTISRIRKKIGDSAKSPKYIHTIKGRGIRLS